MLTSSSSFLLLWCPSFCISSLLAPPVLFPDLVMKRMQSACADQTPPPSSLMGLFKASTYFIHTDSTSNIRLQKSKMTHALCQDTRAKQQTKSVVNVSYRPTFSSAAEVDCTQWRLSSVTALPLLSFYVFFFILQDFIFHSVKIYIWFISSFSVKYLQMSNSFLWSSVNMQHKKIVAVTLLCYGTNVHICEEHRSQTCTSKQRNYTKWTQVKA